MKDPEIIRLEKQVSDCWLRITSKSCLKVSGENEAHYLLKGHATDFIEKLRLPRYIRGVEFIEVCGVLAAKNEVKRYVWIYVYFREMIWRFDTLKEAYNLIDEFQEHQRLEEETNAYVRKSRSRKKIANINEN